MQRFIPAAPEIKSKVAKSSARKRANDEYNDRITTTHAGTAAPGSLSQAESRGPSDPQGRQNAPITALRIFRPPLQATVTLRNGQPTHLVCLRRKEISGDILWMAGPWRSSGDWWEEEGWARDEWDIAIESSVVSRQSSAVVNRGSTGGDACRSIIRNPASAKSSLALYRLVHDLLSGHWFVEGTYD